MSKERKCAYCEKSECKCTFRFGRAFRGRKKGMSMVMQNTTAQTTIGEMREEFNKMLGHLPADTPGVWIWGFTKQGLPKS